MVCEVSPSAYQFDSSDIIFKNPACTAVVTEIGYHNKNTIAAEVEFLALSEWKAELEILVDDLVDEEGKLKRLSDLRSDSGVAWHKVRIHTGLGLSNMVAAQELQPSKLPCLGPSFSPENA